MKFLREVPADKITDEQLKYWEQMHYVIIWNDDSVTVWADCRTEAVS